MEADSGARWSWGAILGGGSMKMMAVTDSSMQNNSCGIRDCDNLLLLLFYFFENKKPVELQYCITFCCKDPNFAM